jgi:hypothetical protein
VCGAYVLNGDVGFTLTAVADGDNAELAPAHLGPVHFDFREYLFLFLSCRKAGPKINISRSPDLCLWGTGVFCYSRLVIRKHIYLARFSAAYKIEIYCRNLFWAQSRRRE